MFFLYFLDTYINLVKYIPKVPLDASISNWRYLHQDAGKTYSEISNMRSYWKYSKATICAGIWKSILETLWLQKNNQGRPPKLSVRQKRNILQQTKRLREEMGNIFVKKSNGKSRYSTIH